MRQANRGQLTGENAMRKSSFPRAFDCWATSVLTLALCSEDVAEVFRTVGQVNQVESFGGRRVANLLEPDLRSAFGMTPILNDDCQLGPTQLKRAGTCCVPMKHDPLRDGDNALLGLVQSRELGFDGVVRVRHGRRGVKES